TSVWPRCRPKPRTSVTVTPETPKSPPASRTSSSLCVRTIAVISFMDQLLPRRRGESSPNAQATQSWFKHAPCQKWAFAFDNQLQSYSASSFESAALLWCADVLRCSNMFRRHARSSPRFIPRAAPESQPRTLLRPFAPSPTPPLRRSHASNSLLG